MRGTVRVYINATADNRAVSIHLTEDEARDYARRFADRVVRIYEADRGTAITARSDRIKVGRVLREISLDRPD